MAVLVCEHTNGFKTGAGDLTLDNEVEYLILNLSGIKILPSDSDRLGCCRVAGCLHTPHCPLSLSKLARDTICATLYWGSRGWAGLWAGGR